MSDYITKGLDLSRVPWTPSIALSPVDWSPDGE